MLAADSAAEAAREAATAYWATWNIREAASHTARMALEISEEAADARNAVAWEAVDTRKSYYAALDAADAVDRALNKSKESADA